MRTAIAVIVFGVAACLAQESPYASEKQRDIKALSADEVLQLQIGAGMGMAKAAELNHYPGPRHVLDNAGHLQLSAQQRTAIQRVYDAMHDRAVALGGEVLGRERRLDGLFGNAQATPEQVMALTAEIARLQGELRATHLQAHIATRALLTREQIGEYDRLRGYTSGAHQHHH